MFETQQCGGIISFITASSYLTGPGFVGMREVMRRTLDELWVIDLGGDSLGARKTPNVFAIQIPVTIAMGIRGKKQNSNIPAKVHYTKIEGATREEKLEILSGKADLSKFNWIECADDWQAPFKPVVKGAYSNWPRLIDLFPYHTAGVVFYRSWPIGETEEVLSARWQKLRLSKSDERAKLFKESRDRKIAHKVGGRSSAGPQQPSIDALVPSSAEPKRVRYGFRSFDRHFAFYDLRVGDYIRPLLGRISGPTQIFLVCPDTEVCGAGPICTVSVGIPDQHYFCGRGAKDVIPLYRGGDETDPNVTVGLLNSLRAIYGAPPSAEDLAAYVYSVLGGQSFTRRFWNELETPGPRVPLTKDPQLFSSAVALGRKLLWLHSYAERFRGEERGDEIPIGAAKIIKGVSDDPAKYPETYAYKPDTREVTIGDGRFGPIASAVWEFQVSGLYVVQSWLGYRMKKRAGKKSSPLDDIRPERWTARMSDEFLELLWVLEATLDMEPELEAVLDKIVAGPCFMASELPAPGPMERKASGETGSLFAFMGDEDTENTEEDADSDASDE